MEFLNSSSLEILNRGNMPTFCSSNRQEVTDINLGSYRLLESIDGWEVCSDPSLSDHRHILFTLRSSVPVLFVRKPRGTNWDSFRRDMREKLERGTKMNTED